MKLLGIVSKKSILYLKKLDLDGYLFPLKNYSSDYDTTFSLEEIKKIKEKLISKSCFVILNRMIFNDEIDRLFDLLKELEKMKVDGILYYDDSVFELVKKYNFDLPLIYNKTHMATNSDTLNLYHKLGVSGAYLSNEITFSDIITIRKKTKLSLMVMLMGYPTVAMSRRSLITNYQKMNGIEKGKKLNVIEPISKQSYFVTEEKNGTYFQYGKRLNASKCYQTFCDIGIDYGILIQDDLTEDEYIEIISSYRKNNLERVDAIIGRNRGFFYRESIYRVKK